MYNYHLSSYGRRVGLAIINIYNTEITAVQVINKIQK
jgi:hypothetical protein